MRTWTGRETAQKAHAQQGLHIPGHVQDGFEA